jgi:Cupin-like domain
MNVLDDSDALNRLDSAAFVLSHRAVGHPALSLHNLGRVIPALPQQQVFYSSGRLATSDNFDTANRDKPNGLSIEATIEQIRTSDSYVMVRQPERDASFADLYRGLKADVTDVMRRLGVGQAPRDPMLYLFIASPKSVTPFHIDRYSTILLQIQGHKHVTVYPTWDQRVVTSAEQDGFMAGTGIRPVYRPEADPLGTRFAFAPGQALHIPFMAGHHVRNGDDEVSVSLSIIFNTDKTATLAKAMCMNQTLRGLGMSPSPIGQDWSADRRKSFAFRCIDKVRRMKRPAR